MGFGGNFTGTVDFSRAVSKTFSREGFFFHGRKTKNFHGRHFFFHGEKKKHCARSMPKPLKMPSLARSVPKPLLIELREAGGHQPGTYEPLLIFAADLLLSWLGPNV